MSHDRINCENVEMYVLGGLDEADQVAFDQHLQSCPECLQQVAELQEIVDMLPMSSEPVIVPSGMKERVLGNILKPNTTKQPLPFYQAKVQKRSYTRWINVGLAAAVLLLLVYSVNLRSQVNNLNDELSVMNEPAQGLKMDQVVTLSSAAQDIVAQGLATIVIDTQGTHLLVQAEKLPAIKGNEAFQVWLMKDGSDVVNAGTFYPHDGKGDLYFTLDSSLGDHNQIAITREPDAFGKLPRGTPVLTAAIQL